MSKKTCVEILNWKGKRNGDNVNYNCKLHFNLKWIEIGDKWKWGLKMGANGLWNIYIQIWIYLISRIKIWRLGKHNFGKNYKHMDTSFIKINGVKIFYISWISKNLNLVRRSIVLNVGFQVWIWFGILVYYK